MPHITRSSVSKRRLKELKNNRVMEAYTPEIIELQDNPVLEYLKERPHHILSDKTISRVLKIKRSKVHYYIENTKYITSPNPFLVGSSKDTLNVYQYTPKNEGINLIINEL